MVDKNDFVAKQFLRGFDDELQNLIEIEYFYTDNGRDECAKVAIRGKEFDVKYWNTFAYFYGVRPSGYKNYIFAYEVAEAATKDGTMRIGFDMETFGDRKITIKLMEHYFPELKQRN